MHSPREIFHSYLQSLDVARADVPDEFRDRLTRVLGYYGVDGLDRTAELEVAMFRVFLAQQRMAANAAIIAELLRRWVASAPPAEPLRERAGLALEHLIAATQVRFPAVSDLARGVVFRWFAQPLLRRNRARVYAAVRANLRYLDAQPDAPDRAERIQAMVGGSEPLVRLLGQRITSAGDESRQGAAARGAHAPLLRQLQAGQRDRARRRGLPSSPPRTAGRTGRLSSSPRPSPLTSCPPPSAR